MATKPGPPRRTPGDSDAAIFVTRAGCVALQHGLASVAPKGAFKRDYTRSSRNVPGVSFCSASTNKLSLLP